MFHDVKVCDKGLVWNTDLTDALELENLLRIILCYIFNLDKTHHDKDSEGDKEGTQRCP